MITEDLHRLIRNVLNQKYDRDTVALRKAAPRARRNLYETLSAFANRNGGGVILFGIDGSNGAVVTGVPDTAKLRADVEDEAAQLEPEPAIVFSSAKLDGKNVVAAEVAECDDTAKPCFYKGAGKQHGAYTRTDGKDRLLSALELYGYEAYKRSIRDDCRLVPRAEAAGLDDAQLQHFFSCVRRKKPRLALLGEERMLSLLGLLDGGRPTLAAVLLFAEYPQAFFPSLRLIAALSDGNCTQVRHARYIEGTIPQILEETAAFVRAQTWEDFLPEASRELVLNALMHRDYSAHSEQTPVRLIIYRNRIEVQSPGGMFGSLSGTRSDTLPGIKRNPFLAGALEVLGLAENRGSGIPLVRLIAEENRLEAPHFESTDGVFTATFYRRKEQNPTDSDGTIRSRDMQRLLIFCAEPRSREEICAFLGLRTAFYAVTQYVRPLIEAGKLRMTLPATPRSKNQRYVTV